MWGRRRDDQIASRLPRHQKRDTFFISYLACEKKEGGGGYKKKEEMQDGGKERTEGTERKARLLLGAVQKKGNCFCGVWFFSEGGGAEGAGPAEKGWAEA